jgi:hypothetical protein
MESMNPISIGKFLLGIVVLGLMWLVFKPTMDSMLTDVLPPTCPALVPGAACTTQAELVIFELLIWVCASILLIWLVIKLTKRDRD